MNTTHNNQCSRMRSAWHMAGFALLMLLPAALNAQFGGRGEQPSSSDRPSQLKSGLQDLQQFKKDAESKLALLPMDGPVNPEYYVVGPNDLFTVGVWGPVMFQLAIPVSPEGSLIVPTVGEVPVAGKTLAAAKREVADRIRSRYTMGDISVTLTTPRSFTVSLRGSVLVPGTYTASAVDRVDKILRLGAAVITPTPTLSVLAVPLREHRMDDLGIPSIEQRAALYDKASTRNILLARRSRDTLRVDLGKYEATGDDRYNPYLRDGDAIIVPRRDMERNFISIQGAVNMPGNYEYVAGDRLSDLVAIAHGMTSDASGSAVVSRFSSDGASSREIRVPLSILRSGGADEQLLRGDRIIVERAADARGNFSVSVRGEVASPGVYPISGGGTRLTAVLKAAGGLTTGALPRASVILRRIDQLSSDVTLRYDIARNWRTAEFTIADSLYYLQVLREGLAPVKVDMAALMNGDSSQDVVLEDGDIIFIARDLRTVYVDGQVAHPGFQPWKPDADLDWYLDAAGGTTDMAETGDIRVIKSGSLEWVDPDETEIQSGDKIWVPKHVPLDLATLLSMFRAVATFLTAFATVGILIYQVTKD